MKRTIVIMLLVWRNVHYVVAINCSNASEFVKVMYKVLLFFFGHGQQVDAFSRQAQIVAE